MKVFMDSSALAKRYLDEAGSDEVDRILADATSLGLSVLCVPEVISALCRRRRESSITRRQYQEAKQALLDDVHDAHVINLTPSVVRSAVDALESNVLRAMDALHIGSAVEWEPELFVSADARQIEAASGSGLQVRGV